MAPSFAMDSPLGPLVLELSESGALRRLSFCPDPGDNPGDAPKNTMVPDISATGDLSYLTSIKEQILEYLSGIRQAFDFPVDLQGTPFQKRVWAALRKTNYGKTLTYSELATQCGSPKAVRATASAVASNPIPILVPCHRIVPKSGGLGQYALHSLPPVQGQLIKKQLLGIEQKNSQDSRKSPDSAQ